MIRKRTSGHNCFRLTRSLFRAVHWIAALDYPLALLWGCLTLLAYLHYRDQPHPLRLVLFYFSLLLSLLAHLVTALILPFFVYLLWRQKQPLRTCLRHFAWPLFLSPLLLYGVLSSTSKATTTWWAIERYAADGGGGTAAGVRQNALVAARPHGHHGLLAASALV